MQVYNTLGRELQDFTPIEDNLVKIYQCGPTVYSEQHIGNMRAVVIGDTVRTILEFIGYDVSFITNYTDFGHLVSDSDEGEDKMVKGASREGLTVQEVAEKYTKIFNQDRQKLIGRQPKSLYASENVDEMIAMTQELLDKGYAYSTPEAIYFDVSKFEKYTELSGQKLEENRQGAGHGDQGETSKRNHADFALWFFKAGKRESLAMSWESPFESPLVENGEGTPGWHIECSAMIRTSLGKHIDIHIGGIEHIALHHPNERAQSEAANDEKFVNYWLHNEHLTVDGEKMSKSLGNVYYLRDLESKGYDPLDFRYFLLQAHYRSKQNFTFEALEAAATARKKILQRVVDLSEIENGEVSEKYLDKFKKVLSEDFNTPQALALLWDLLKDTKIDKSTEKATFLKFDEVLKIGIAEAVKIGSISDDRKIPEKAQKLLDEREKARSDKNWDEADRLRDLLAEKYDIKVKDTDHGQEILDL